MSAPENREAAEYAAAAPELERAAASAPALTFTKEDLIFLACGDSPIGVRRSAAEALYALGERNGALDLSAALKAAPTTVRA